MSEYFSYFPSVVNGRYNGVGVFTALPEHKEVGYFMSSDGRTFRSSIFDAINQYLATGDIQIFTGNVYRVTINNRYVSLQDILDPENPSECILPLSIFVRIYKCIDVESEKYADNPFEIVPSTQVCESVCEVLLSGRSDNSACSLPLVCKNGDEMQLIVTMDNEYVLLDWKNGCVVSKAPVSLYDDICDGGKMKDYVYYSDKTSVASMDQQKALAWLDCVRYEFLATGHLNEVIYSQYLTNAKEGSVAQ